MPAAAASSYIFAGVGERGEADLADVARRAGRPRAGSGPDCRSSALSVSRMSKWASRVIRPISASGRPRPCAAGRVTALLPPSRMVRSWAAVQRPTASRIGAKPSAGISALTGDVAGIVDGETELEAVDQS